MFQAHNKPQLKNNDLNVSINDAVNLCNDRKYKEARGLLKLIIQDNPKNSDAWMMAAQIDLREYGLISLAFDELIESLRLQPNNIAALLTMGHLFMVHKKDNKTAITYYEKILEISPNNPVALNSLGLIYQEMDEFDDALIYYDKGILADPRMINGWYGKAFIYFTRKQYALAFSLCVDGMKKAPVTPESEELYTKLGQLLLDAAELLINNIDLRTLSNSISREIESTDNVKVYCKEYNDKGITSFLGFGPDRQLGFHNIVYNAKLLDVEYRLLHELIHIKILQHNYNIGIRIPYELVLESYHAFHQEYVASYKNLFGQLSREEIDKRIANHSVMMFAHLISGVMDLYIQYEIFTSLEYVRPAQLQSFILELKRKDQRALNIKDMMPEILFNKILILNHLEALNLQELYGINLLSEITMSSVCIEASYKLFNIYKESIKCHNYRDNISNTITRIAESLKINI